MLSIQTLAHQITIQQSSIPEVDDSHLSLVERRPWTNRANRQLPRRFRDVLPQPPPALPPSLVDGISSGHNPDAPQNRSLRRVFTSPQNVFGLLRQYEVEDMRPIYDPEAQLSLDQLSNFVPLSIPTKLEHQPYLPYPNRSSFLLGNWFWNDGAQKSLASFNSLMDIITSPDFQTSDICNVKWDQINAELSREDIGEWVDEDAGWKCTSISLSIPYQARRGEPCPPDAGPQNFVVGDFYYRPLTSVIREKIGRLTEESLFHFEPYELYWESVKGSHPIRVQGELYTAPAFIEAHQKLQASPREPGCNLPRVIAALMLASDGMQLTAFGSGKLWPVYGYFGNDTKYHRCKPACHLCEHIAYFQTVSHYPNLYQ